MGEIDLMDMDMTAEESAALDAKLSGTTANTEGHADKAPAAEPGKADAQPAQKPDGHAPEGSPDGEHPTPAPGGEKKQAEQQAAGEGEKPPTAEEIAEAMKEAKRVKDFQAAATRAQQELAETRRELAALKAAKTADETPEGRHARLSAELEQARRQGFTPSVPYETEADALNGPQVFMELAQWQVRQEAAQQAMHAGLMERQNAVSEIFTALETEHGEAFKSITEKVIEHIKEESLDFSVLPLKHFRHFIEDAVRAVDPKLFEKADMAKEHARIKNIRKSAALSATATEGNPAAPEATDDVSKTKSALLKAIEAEESDR